MLHACRRGQTPTYDEAPVPEKDLVTLRIRDGKIIIVERTVLVEEPVIGGNQNVREIG
jgi:hypothetical protein